MLTEMVIMQKNILGKTIILSIIIVLPGCTHRSNIIVKKIKVGLQKEQTDISDHVHIQPPPITVWIHGTMFLKKPFFHEIFQKDASLNLAIYANKKFYSHQIAEALYMQDPAQYPLETAYAFAWSGMLSAAARLDAAKKLYNQLITLIDKYVLRWNVYPQIRIIAHSHGGNVALNLALVEKIYQRGLKINTLLLLACPVQKETMPYAASNIFEHMYSLYSALDIVQVIAPQQGVSKVPFSKRIFPIDLKVLQAQVKINGRAIFHTDFTSKYFVQSIPSILSELYMLEAHYGAYIMKKIVFCISVCKQKISKHSSVRARKRYLVKKRVYVSDLFRKKNFLPIYLS